MPGDMKFEESSLTRYLVKNLEPLTEADPVILAEYVATLLKKDKPIKELQKLCTDNLVEFLGHDTKSFITKLFQALEDGLVLSSTEGVDGIKQAEQSAAVTTVDLVGQGNLSPKLEKFSSGPVTDPEEKEVSDDDDDDRNHKHRRRGTRSMSSDKDAQEQLFRRPNKRRDHSFENGQSYLGNDPQSSEIRKEYNLANLDGAKVEKRHTGLAPLSRSLLDMGHRTRAPQKLRGDIGPRFDVSASLGRLPIGRGRGRSSGSWNQHESRFSSVDTLDFSSHMATQGPIPPSLYAGRGIPDATTQSGSWGAYGLIHGMPNGGLEALHPLGLQGALRPTISTPLNIGISHQRCRDFEERGFCLRGDMCPMEHGVNRIVVEDVQSLSQFNLPVSIPSARLLGVQGGSGSLPPVSAPSNALTNGKGLHGKISKPGVSDDGAGLNGMFPASTESAEADLYDPDQPLWSNDHPETSGALLRLPSPKLEVIEPSWGADLSDRQSFKSADGNDSERQGRSLSATGGSQSTASVWGRIGNSGDRLDVAGKIDSTISTTGYLGNEMREDQVEKLCNIRSSFQQGKRATTEEVSPKARNFSSSSKLRTDSMRNVGKGFHKAMRTLFVNGIPLTNNKREALLSHFKKFGEVIDIYIPVNSERAFVQFSKKEEAEAALKAPDAVMGNRFIKLWWANRDSIPDGGESLGNVAMAFSRGLVAASVPSHPSAEVGKENNPSATLKLSTTPISDTTMPATVPSRSVATNSPKGTPPSQKKLETLELLEELRKKQEMLDQKRNDFRRQLDKLEKQAITVKGETASEQRVKRHKVEPVTDVPKSSTPKHTNPVSPCARSDQEKTLDRSTSVENVVSSSARLNPTILQQSPRSVKQPSLPPALNGTPFMVNRFKLDNRPTAFRILPPLPADIANVHALKEHFSSFGDLSSVELEGHEGNGSSSGPKTSQNLSAYITFTTRRTAERAFLNGKCCQGHNLQFTWLTTSRNSSTNHNNGEISPTTKGPLDAELQVGDSSSKGKALCAPISQPAATRNEETESVDGMEGNCECTQKDMVEDCSTKLMSEKQLPEADVPVTSDDRNVSFSE